MPKLFHLHIENFRGIEKFDHTFKDGLTCIIGRGDSGKTTILEAISYALTPLHTLVFHDGDFYNCNINKPIKIEVTLTDLPPEILRKLGDRIRGVKDKEILTSMIDPEVTQNGVKEAVTIQLKVEKDLEPEWLLMGAYGVEPRAIRASEREMFNCFYITEYNDRHFTLSKGTPLSSLFRQKAEKKAEVLNAERIAELGRNVKSGFDGAIEADNVFHEVISSISENANELGLSSEKIRASIDQRELLLRENKISLHKDNIPLRQLGKGSKRLLSLAIQLSLTDPSGIILIDEIEQGLEPDRVQHIVSILKKKAGLQVILTTHSSNAIVELSCSDIFIRRNSNNNLIQIPSTSEMQGTLRKNPEAFFAKRVLICEGATEVGIIRGINDYALQPKGKSLTSLGIRYADGAGKNLIKYVPEFSKLGYDVCLFCDSDAPDVNAKKKEFESQGIVIADCEDELAIEQQLFKDLPWDSVIKLMEYHLDDFSQDSKTLYESVNNLFGSEILYAEDWWKKESLHLRKAFGEKAKAEKKKNGAWFKDIEHGEFLASVILSNLRNIDKSSRLHSILKVLSRWILNQG